MWCWRCRTPDAVWTKRLKARSSIPSLRQNSPAAAWVWPPYRASFAAMEAVFMWTARQATGPGSEYCYPPLINRETQPVSFVDGSYMPAQAEKMTKVDVKPDRPGPGQLT